MTVSLVPRDPGTARRPKDTLEVRGEWRLHETPKVLEARLFWFTRGKGTEDVSLVDTRAVAPSLVGDANFRFRLPDAPYSFSGKLITLAWAVEMVADDEVARWEFTMSPNGTEIRLNPVVDHAGG